MRNLRARATLSSLVYAFPLTLAILGLFAACASAPGHPAPEHPDWIRIGVTTKDEVIQRYGQPDLVIASTDGDTVVYRPTASAPSAPRVEIPIVQAGPLGSSTTRMQTINPGLDANDVNTKMKGRLRSEIRIRYDARGLVQELSPP
ncbi:MAG: hypothetical protein HXY51_12655 [Nitrospirae bacterium]|nr:hypothetical protein [Nitrospirota bacterium]